MCSIVLEQNDTMPKQVWLFMVNSQSHFMLRDCAVILANDCHTNWHGMVKRKCILAEELDMHDLKSIWLCHAVFFIDDFWACHPTFYCFS
jgi:hypothetical protein